MRPKLSLTDAQECGYLKGVVQTLQLATGRQKVMGSSNVKLSVSKRL